VKGFGFSWRSLELAAPEDLSDLLGRLSARSHFRNAFSAQRELHQRYWMPLTSAVAEILPSVIEHLERTRPAMILADAHLYSDWYARAAGCCGARLVLHQALAPLTFNHRLYVRVFGYRSPGVVPASLIEMMGMGWKTALKFSGIARQPIRTVQARSTMRRVRCAAEKAFARCPRPAASPYVVHSGVGALECQLQPPETQRRVHFLLVSTKQYTREGVPPELMTWIGRQQRPVIYVCFGTMVRLRRAMVETMARGFIDADVSTIWVLPDHDSGIAPTNVSVDRFRIERCLPQAEVLASEKVAAFVGCGGSGSVLEALGHGHPVLSIPFTWDQTYNASVVTRLGAGFVLDKRNLSADSISKAVRDLIGEPSYTERAREIERVLRDPPEDFAVESWIDSLGLRL
jgi:hypothetical protein